MTLHLKLLALLLVCCSICDLPLFLQAKVVQEEVEILKEIASTLGYKSWLFNADNCTIEDNGSPTIAPTKKEVGCVCLNGDPNDCHVQSITIKYYNLNGVLPPQLVKLPYLTSIDFACNYLNGSIPREWASSNLSYISVTVNRLSGEIPKELGKLTSLTYLNLEGNRFSGTVPKELGNLVNLGTLMLSSNMLSGSLPESLGQLPKLTDFRINDNDFAGVIPTFIQNWKNLTRLEIHGSGLDGPIPKNISVLNNMQTLRISDIGGPNQPFPDISQMSNISHLVLRSCNIADEVPKYLWFMDTIQMLDLSFNNLVGGIPVELTLKLRMFLFFTGNMLSGDIPLSLLKDGTSVDLSYNNFTFQDSDQPTCDTTFLNLKVNLYRSSSYLNSPVRPRVPCLSADTCSRHARCLRVDCGGTKPNISKQFIEDGDIDKSQAALYYIDSKKNWGVSSTGDYMDDHDFLNLKYVDFDESPTLPVLYRTARRAPIMLTYFHRCLENGIYDVTLYFAELKFTNDETYMSLGRRVFDIYVQDKLVRKNFNIMDEVHCAKTPYNILLNNVNVSQNHLEVRLYYAGKGTTRIPARGYYGPIISGISFTSASKRCGAGREREILYIVAGVCGLIVGVSALIGCGVWWKKKERTKTGDDSELPTGTFSLKQIKEATNDFDSKNKIGEGGFGPVYKGTLADGKVVAVKQLSSKSKQGNREFLNEIAMISCLRHPNLVKLHGFCVEGKQLLLVYEYMENNNLRRALFGQVGQRIELDWPTRHKICIGIARGLAFLHEESALKIVHRDIKATNVLLDKHLNPKISDFGLARLNEEEKSHISTRIAGTLGYMSPEYALWGYLTDKVDVYGFGIVALELISGRNNNDSMPTLNCFCLVDKAVYLQQNGSLIEIVDESLRGNMVEEEALVMAKVALLCANASPNLRPSMSEVVGMLEGRVEIPHVEAFLRGDDGRFRALSGPDHGQPTTQSSTQSFTDGSVVSYNTTSSVDRSLLTHKTQYSHVA